MTRKKIRSIKGKLARIKKNNPDIDFEKARKKFFEIEAYYKLSQELFFLEFELNRCQTCGKKL
jgi:hypothetical protein